MTNQKVSNRKYILFRRIMYNSHEDSVFFTLIVFFEYVIQLKSFRNLYEGHVPMKYRRYLRKMKRLNL